MLTQALHGGLTPVESVLRPRRIWSKFHRRLETMRLGLVDVVWFGDPTGDSSGDYTTVLVFRAKRTISCGRQDRERSAVAGEASSRVEHPLRLLNRCAAQGAHCIGARAENRIHTAGAQALVAAGQEDVRARPLQADDAQHALLLLAQPQLQRLQLRLKRGRSCYITGRRRWWCARRRWRRRWRWQ